MNLQRLVNVCLALFLVGTMQTQAQGLGGLLKKAKKTVEKITGPTTATSSTATSTTTLAKDVAMVGGGTIANPLVGSACDIELVGLYGKTTYTFKKLITLWMNGFTAFSVKPLRLATIFGVVTAIAGFLWGLVIVIQKLLNPAEILAGYSSMMAALFVIGGVIMLMLGLIGEYIGRIYISINRSPQYVVREVYCGKQPQESGKQA